MSDFATSTERGAEWQPGRVLEELAFVYLPSDDVAGELPHYVDQLGAEVVWAIERFGTRVAQLQMPGDGPLLLLAQHLHGDRPVLIYRVPDLAAAEAELARRGATTGERFGFPDGDAVEVELPGPQRVAVYERTRPDRAASIVGRRDF
jgi:hypothetical protein